MVSRAAAVDCLWDERPPARAEAALQVYVHHLRQALGPEAIVTHGTGYLLRADIGDVDALLFERRLSEGRVAFAAGDARRARALLDEALELWRGEPLADLPSVPFVLIERERLAGRRLDAEELQTDIRLALGEHAELVPELTAFVAEHPFHERAWGQLLVALYRAGRQADALDTYRRAHERLDEIGIEPSPQLRELERAVLRHDPSLDLERPVAGERRLAVPRPSTTLVGRGLEIAAVRATFESSGARLLTLVGPGGIGKTRLAIAVAQNLGPSMADGAVFVDLASLPDSALVLSATASALGLATESEGVGDALFADLEARELLLVLDNFEHVLDAAPAIAHLLARAPRLRVLVTSRIPLHLSGEHLYTVPPLDVPSEHVRHDELSRNDAVTVFAARARAVDGSFRLNDENAPLVAEICRLLDGLPLAIELAAARCKLLSPRQILERVVRPLELLTGGGRDSPMRQQTLRATIEWSYALLEPLQQTLFAQVSVFVGSCSLDAVDEVCGSDLNSLAALLDHSLLGREQAPGGEPRFRMLTTIRDYANALVNDDERSELRRRHAHHFLRTAEQTSEMIAGAGAREAELLAQIEQDHDNYRAALTWAEESGERDVLLRLVAALRLFWMVRGHLAEGRAWFETALDAPGGVGDGHRAAALSAGGTLVYRAGEYELARRWWQEALDRYVQAGDARAAARTMSNLAGIAHAEGDLDRATELWRRSAEQLRELGDEMRLAIALGNLGVAASSSSRYDDAVLFLEEALLLARHSHNWITECSILFNLGRAKFELGDLAASRHLLQDALRIANQLGYRELVAYSLLGLADIAAAEGDLDLGRRLLRACNSLATSLGIHFQGDELVVHERATSQLGVEETSGVPGDVDVAAAVEAGLAAKYGDHHS